MNVRLIILKTSAIIVDSGKAALLPFSILNVPDTKEGFIVT